MKRICKIVVGSIVLMPLGLASGCGGQTDKLPTSTVSAPKGNKPESAEEAPPRPAPPPVPRR